MTGSFLFPKKKAQKKKKVQGILSGGEKKRRRENNKATWWQQDNWNVFAIFKHFLGFYKNCKERNNEVQKDLVSFKDEMKQHQIRM